MTSCEQLHARLGTHMPGLAADLAGMTPADSRARLNALTGAQAHSCDTIEDAQRIKSEDKAKLNALKEAA